MCPTAGPTTRRVPRFTSSATRLAAWHLTIRPRPAGGAKSSTVCCCHAGPSTPKYLLSSTRPTRSPSATTTHKPWRRYGLRLLHLLKDCHVRLCGKREPRLQHLAEEAVRQARGIPRASGPLFMPPPLPVTSRLTDLPRELRLRILEFTDLVTPYQEVLWGRDSGGYFIQRGPCDPDPDSQWECPPEFHHGCQFSECYREQRPGSSIGCFCRRYHTAASSSPCRCWAPRTSLFLVCRTLHADAGLVLYSENRFIVVDGDHPDDPFIPWWQDEYPHHSFAASHFLRHDVPPHCLGHIRFLELTFSPFTHLTQPRDGHPALQDWSETLNWAKNKLKLPALMLRLVVAGNVQYYEPEGAREMTQAQGEKVLALYHAIYAPLRSLDVPSEGGLARFYADLAWPWQWTPWVDSRLEEAQGGDWVEYKNRELKRHAEQLVMAERYCPGGEPAGEPGPSAWTWFCLLYAAGL